MTRSPAPGFEVELGVEPVDARSRGARARRRGGADRRRVGAGGRRTPPGRPSARPGSSGVDHRAAARRGMRMPREGLGHGAAGGVGGGRRRGDRPRPPVPGAERPGRRGRPAGAGGVGRRRRRPASDCGSRASTGAVGQRRRGAPRRDGSAAAPSTAVAAARRRGPSAARRLGDFGPSDRPAGRCGRRTRPAPTRTPQPEQARASTCRTSEIVAHGTALGPVARRRR